MSLQVFFFPEIQNLRGHPVGGVDLFKSHYMVAWILKGALYDTCFVRVSNVRDFFFIHGVQDFGEYFLLPKFWLMQL